MLINLTNHPSTKWKGLQLETAKNNYTEIIDLPFPNIPPEATKEEIKKLAKEYLEKIEAYKTPTVHIAGEMTFTYCLINKLKKRKIPCVASTSKRNIIHEADGTKTMKFEFKQFRPYF